MASSPDYTILNSPRISAAAFAAVLRGAGSPAAPEAATCYQAFVGAGVDPAVGLAIFRKESTYGRFGRAHHNRSWGNIRGSGPYPLDSGHFRVYPSWSAGAADAARLLAIYGSNRIRPGTNTSSVQTFPYVWAPSSDGNAPDRYGDQLAAWIKDWTGNAGTVINADPASYTTGDDRATKILALLTSLGISTDPNHVISAPEAERIIHNDPGYFFSDPIALEGKTVSQLAGLSESHDASPGYEAQNAIGNAIGALPGAIGEVLIHVAVLLGILGLIGMGVWFVARSED